MKECVECKQFKPLTEYTSRGGGKKRSQCKKCYNSNWKYRIMSSLTSREAHRVRENGTVKKNIYRDNGINGEFLEFLKENQNGVCYWLKIPIDFTMKDKLRKPSLDRLDNTKGYEIGNVVLTTVFANLGRRDATTNEMSDFIKNYL
jgi:hypothetical protein